MDAYPRNIIYYSESKVQQKVVKNIVQSCIRMLITFRFLSISRTINSDTLLCEDLFCKTLLCLLISYVFNYVK